MVNDREGANQSEGTLTKFWEILKKNIIIFNAIVVIVAQLLSISFLRIPELNFFILGILITIGAVGISRALLAARHSEIGSSKSPLSPSVQELSQFTNEATYSSYSKFYGLAFENLAIYGTLHEDGSMTIRRESRIIAHTSGIAAIDQYLLSDAREGAIQVINVECQDSAFREISTQIHKATSEGLTLTAKISPPLVQGETVNLVIEEKTPPGAITRTFQEMIDRNKPHQYECFFWDITRPVKRLEMKLFVPEGLAPHQVAADVWFGPTRITCHQELGRVSSSLTRRPFVAEHEEISLIIMYPLPGLIYTIKWIPKKN
ncbi:MAG: hypothetical protein AB1817_06035 [Chloroflexota bacterium]